MFILTVPFRGCLQLKALPLPPSPFLSLASLRSVGGRSIPSNNQPAFFSPIPKRAAAGPRNIGIQREVEKGGKPCAFAFFLFSICPLSATELWFGESLSRKQHSAWMLVKADIMFCFLLLGKVKPWFRSGRKTISPETFCANYASVTFPETELGNWDAFFLLKLYTLCGK